MGTSEKSQIHPVRGSLWRVLRREGLLPEEAPKKKDTPKPYEQMRYPGQRVQIDVMVLSCNGIADPERRLFQDTAIDAFFFSLANRYCGSTPLFFDF